MPDNIVLLVNKLELLPHFKSITDDGARILSCEQTDREARDNRQALIVARDGELLYAPHSSFCVVENCALLKEGRMRP